MENETENEKIYCDWAATALFDKEILKNALEQQLLHAGNPSSVHQAGIDAKKELQNVRERCAKVLGVKSENIFFTSGGTESDHLPITNLLLRPNKGSIVISNIEHPAVTEMAENMKKCGWKVNYARCDKNGFVSAQSVINALDADTALVCVMAVNNETGAIQPIEEISAALTKECAGKRKPKLHVDCVQAAGKIPLNLIKMDVDSAAFSAHKIGGPRGIGLLYLKEINQQSFLKGGGQEGGVRSGTENLFGSECMASCLEKYFISAEEDSETYTRYKMQQVYTKEFIEKLQTNEKFILIPESRKADDNRFSPWIVQCAFKNIPGEVMVRALSEKGIYISTGSACSSRKMKRPILEARGIKGDIAQWGVRFSFGSHTTQFQMERVVLEVNKITDSF